MKWSYCWYVEAPLGGATCQRVKWARTGACQRVELGRAWSWEGPHLLLVDYHSHLWTFTTMASLRNCVEPHYGYMTVRKMTVPANVNARLVPLLLLYNWPRFYHCTTDPAIVIIWLTPLLFLYDWLRYCYYMIDPAIVSIWLTPLLFLYDWPRYCYSMTNPAIVTLWLTPLLLLYDRPRYCYYMMTAPVVLYEKI